jgi:hypothetical protein
MKLMRLLLPVLLVISGIAQGAAAAAAAGVPTAAEIFAEASKRLEAATRHKESLERERFKVLEAWNAAGKPTEGILYTSLTTAREASREVEKAYEAALEEYKKSIERMTPQERSDAINALLPPTRLPEVEEYSEGEE